jgi:hypothetical protein
MLDATLTKPKATRPMLATAILLWLLLASVPVGQAITPAVTSDDDWRWALTQGGLTLVVLVLGWSYRKDLTRWADEKVALERQLAEARGTALDEKIAFQQARIDEALRYHRMLEALMERTNETMKANSDALGLHTTAMARNTDSTHRLANAVEKLDSRMERVEHQK